MSAQTTVDQIRVLLSAGPAAFAGVGSRETPRHVCQLMAAVARKLTDAGWTLRSGGADGADLAFESGVREGMAKEIFLPYKGFNGGSSSLTKIAPQAFEIASKVHPAWERCTDFARKAHARNAHQVLGPDLNDPVKMVICWTKDGALDAASARNAGGTRTAIVLGAQSGAVVFNLQREDVFHAFMRWAGEELLAETGQVLRMQGGKGSAVTASVKAAMQRSLLGKGASPVPAKAAAPAENGSDEAQATSPAHSVGFRRLLRGR